MSRAATPSWFDVRDITRSRMEAERLAPVVDFDAQHPIEIVRAGQAITIRLAGGAASIGGAVFLEIAAAIAGQWGMYNAHVYTGGPRLDLAGPLTLSHFGVKNATATARVWHPDDAAPTSHRLLPGQLILAQPLGSIAAGADKGKTVYSTTVALPLFVLQVFRDGGADGGATAAATYTYTLKSGAITVKTAQAVYKPRPIGKRAQAPDGSYAICFTVGNTFYLYDVNEVETRVSCGPGAAPLSGLGGALLTMGS